MFQSGTTGDRRENYLSEMVDNIFDRYTVIPSSVADEEEIDELRESLENLGADIRSTRSVSSNHAQGGHNSAALGDTAIDPRQTQLPSSSAGEYARKTVPLSLWKTMPPQNSPTSSPSSNDNDAANPPTTVIIDSDSDDNVEAKAACERCSEHNIKCELNLGTRGAACRNCRLKRRKCSFVPEPKPKPGARGISTPPDGQFDSFSSELYNITDSNDESFELDSYRVTLQRVFGKVSYLTKTQEDRFARLEAQLGRIEEIQSLILKKLENSGH